MVQSPIHMSTLPLSISQFIVILSLFSSKFFSSLKNLDQTISIALDIQMRNPKVLSSSFFILLILYTNFSLAIATITAVSKDQITCTMCSACDNPCQQLPSPPPPPPPISTCPPPPPPPSPPPPPAIVADCPPPPYVPSSGSYYYSPPPPSSVPTYVFPSPPPPTDVGEFYPPPNYGNYPAPPPPYPIVPYFPYYYYNPPPGSASNSVLLKIHPIVLTIFFSFLFLYSY